MVPTRLDVREELLVHGCTSWEFKLIKHPSKAIRLRLLLPGITSSRLATFLWDTDSTSSFYISSGAGVR